VHAPGGVAAESVSGVDSYRFFEIAHVHESTVIGKVFALDSHVAVIASRVPSLKSTAQLKPGSFC
jgi:hypothetical protein